MIVYPENWREFGKPISLTMIDTALRTVIEDIPSINLSYSGGIDSSLLLYYLLGVKGKAQCFTIANTPEHPDVEYSKKAIAWFQFKYNRQINHFVFIRPNIEGDALVQAYYKALWPLIQDIIVGDCIDELSCGYYAHQDCLETTYHDYLHRLQLEHLLPLDENSGNVAVYLPYADDRVSNLFYRIPLNDKVSETSRKLIVVALADGKVPPEIIERKKYGFATSICR